MDLTEKFACTNYQIGDIIQHKEIESIQRKIIWVFTIFYDMDGDKTELCYNTVGKDNVVRTIKKSNMDMYYKKIE